MLKGNVLIVEDQPNFRKGLRKMFESGQQRWNVVGEAGNGQDALVLLDQVKPDLVLTDIRMPIMDGIEFVSHLRETYPELLVIILTGYKNFEYAQAAVRLGALDLLIKPCTERDVEQVMNKASERLFEKGRQRQLLLSQQRQQQDQQLRAALLDLPYAHMTNSEKSLDDALDGQALWLLQLDGEDLAAKNYGASDMRLIRFALSNIAEELLGQSGLDARLVLVEHDRFVLVARARDVDEQLRTAIRQASMDYLKIRLHITPIGDATPVNRLAERYIRFKQQPADSGASPANASESGGGSSAALSLNQSKVQELEARLQSAIMAGQEDLQPLLSHMLLELSAASLDDMKIQALSLSIALLGTAQKQLGPEEGSSLSRFPSDMPQAHWTAKDVLRWSGEQTAAFMQLFHQWQSARNDGMLERAIKFIEEHYNEDCRLTDVAAHIHLNASYFSVWFKKCTGESFTRYVTRIRMDKAAMLLRNTDMKIFEIACATGFDEPNYFTNVFKQQFLVSPKEYRSSGGRSAPG